MPQDLSQDIRDRTFKFAVAVASLVAALEAGAELKLGPEAHLRELRGEGEQITRILGAIVVSTKRRMIVKHAVFAFCILNFALWNSALLLSS